MNVEINFRRGEIPVLGWDDAFMRRFEQHMEEHPEDGNPSDREGFYRRFMTDQRSLIACVEKILGDDTDGPFTITIKVEGERKKYGPGPMNY